MQETNLAQKRPWDKLWWKKRHWDQSQTQGHFSSISSYSCAL